MEHTFRLGKNAASQIPTNQKKPKIPFNDLRESKIVIKITIIPNKFETKPL